MLDWLQFTFGSFFYNKIAKKGANKSMWNVIFALFLLLVIMISFYSAGYNYSFATKFDKASKFKDFTYQVFVNEDEASRINLSYHDEKLSAYHGLDKNDAVLINTFENDMDKAKYNNDEYNVIIDTRDSSSTFCKFEITYYLTKDESVTISADEYRTSSNQKDYSAKLNVLNEVYVPTNEDCQTYLSFIDSNISDNQKTEYEEVKAMPDKSSQEYYNAVYSLWVKVKYMLQLAPTNQTYLQQTYAILDNQNNYVYKNYIILTDTWALISFTNDKNINVTFDGYYTLLPDNFSLFELQNKTEIDRIKSQCDTFISSIYSSVDSYRLIFMGIMVFRYLPYILIAMLVLALLVFCMCKLRRRSYGDKYFGSFKIVSSFSIMSATLASITAFILCFILSTENALTIGMWSYLAILGLRTIILVFVEELLIRKDPSRDNLVTTSKYNKDDDSYQSELAPLDLKDVDTGTKVIKNEKVKDDDDEKMEFM